MPTRRYIRKPVVVSAEGPITEPREITTLEGTMRANVGDYVVTGVQGEQYPVKPDIFHAIYILVEDAD